MSKKRRPTEAQETESGWGLRRGNGSPPSPELIKLFGQIYEKSRYDGLY